MPRVGGEIPLGLVWNGGGTKSSGTRSVQRAGLLRLGVSHTKAGHPREEQRD